MLRRPRAVRRSFVETVVDAGGDEQRWMLLQDDDTLGSYVADVLLASDAPDRQAIWLLSQPRAGARVLRHRRDRRALAGYLLQSSTDSATSSRCERPAAVNRLVLVRGVVLVVMVAPGGGVTIFCDRRPDVDAPEE